MRVTIIVLFVGALQLRAKFLIPFLLVVLCFSLLFQIQQVYATPLFSDGFESGDFTAWTAHTQGAGDTINVVTTDKNSGTYSAYAAYDGSGTEYAFISETFTGQTTVYSRAYLKFKTSIASGGSEVLQNFLGTDRYTHLYLSSATSITLASRNKAAWDYTTNSSISLAIDTWYCIESYMTVNAVSGAYSVWINGMKTIGVTGKNSTALGNVVSCRWGEWYGGETSAHAIYIDDVVIDSSYIGPIVSGVQLSFTFYPNLKQYATSTKAMELGFTQYSVAKTIASLTPGKELVFTSPTLEKLYGSILQGKELAYTQNSLLQSYTSIVQSKEILITNLVQIESALLKLDGSLLQGKELAFTNSSLLSLFDSSLSGKEVSFTQISLIHLFISLVQGKETGLDFNATVTALLPIVGSNSVLVQMILGAGGTDELLVELAAFAAVMSIIAFALFARKRKKTVRPVNRLK